MNASKLTHHGCGPDSSLFSLPPTATRLFMCVLIMTPAVIAFPASAAESAPPPLKTEARGIWVHLSDFSAEPAEGAKQIHEFVNKAADANFNFVLPWVLRKKVVLDLAPTPVLAGIHLRSSGGTNPLPSILKEIEIARECGVAGIVLFSGSSLSGEHLAALKQGPFKMPAAYPALKR